jgi:hypothetical protein
MSTLASSQFYRPLCLDISNLIDRALALGRRRFHSWPIAFENGTLHFAEGKSATAKLVLHVSWPRGSKTAPSGFVCIHNPAWETLPRIILLTGSPTKTGDHLWRFLCPITRKLVRNIYFDPTSQLFVSRATLGREQRRGDFSRIVRHVGQTLELGAKFDRLNAQPPTAGMKKVLTDLGLEALEASVEDEHILFLLAASGVPSPVYREDGSFDVIAMSRKKAPDRRNHVSKIYTCDKSGSLKLSTASRKRFGMSRS